jgi:hypothetical protein
VDSKIGYAKYCFPDVFVISKEIVLLKNSFKLKYSFKTDLFSFFNKAIELDILKMKQVTTYAMS